MSRRCEVERIYLRQTRHPQTKTLGKCYTCECARAGEKESGERSARFVRPLCVGGRDTGQRFVAGFKGTSLEEENGTTPTKSSAATRRKRHIATATTATRSYWRSSSCPTTWFAGRIASTTASSGWCAAATAWPTSCRTIQGSVATTST